MSTFIEINQELAPRLPKGLIASIRSPSNKEHESFYVFALHKCASTMLKRMFFVIGQCNGMEHVGIDEWRFVSNHTYSKDEVDDLRKIFVPRGYWFGVFRQYAIAKANIVPFDISKRSILMVRDPRDILTSLFFSSNFSHVAPGSTSQKLHEARGYQDDDIDRFVVEKAPTFVNTFQRYINELLPHGKTKIFRYEDVILDKTKLILPALDFLDLELPLDQVNRIIQQEHIIPSSEDVSKHIRRVLPGDYKNKLSASTIEQLNDMFRPVLDFFNYEG